MSKIGDYLNRRDDDERAWNMGHGNKWTPDSVQHKGNVPPVDQTEEEETTVEEPAQDDAK